MLVPFERARQPGFVWCVAQPPRGPVPVSHGKGALGIFPPISLILSVPFYLFHPLSHLISLLLTLEVTMAMAAFIQVTKAVCWFWLG